MKSDALPLDEMIEVKTYLRDGDLVALPVGTMATIFRVEHDEVTGETSFEYQCLAAITGAHNVLRRHK